MCRRLVVHINYIIVFNGWRERNQVQIVSQIVSVDKFALLIECRSGLIEFAICSFKLVVLLFCWHVNRNRISSNTECFEIQYNNLFSFIYQKL